jgi:hypothetical protein
MKHQLPLLLIVLSFVLCLFASCSKPAPILTGGRPRGYWLESLSSPDKRLRKEAVIKLGNIGNTEADVAPALVKALDDADAGVRCEAILALMKCGDAAKETVDELKAIERRDPDRRVRSYAAKALEKLIPSAPH